MKIGVFLIRRKKTKIHDVPEITHFILFSRERENATYNA